MLSQFAGLSEALPPLATCWIHDGINFGIVFGEWQSLLVVGEKPMNFSQQNRRKSQADSMLTELVDLFINLNQF